ncbi:hypothetical protein CC77DRAFT_143032 [Alternaria alternata]|uniref:Uncharacterized protein n=1 Tax=Alternaria alternata TaxID=5599 RepID=A0A177DLY9_ALTAL|nr:hypothetical protein CC77DRAFT_143032 [Alternaria alternata]OAG19829.1 hypothetical protein CC77DRAFT_143032 [Alternaria alternata]
MRIQQFSRCSAVHFSATTESVAYALAAPVRIAYRCAPNYLAPTADSHAQCEPALKSNVGVWTPQSAYVHEKLISPASTITCSKQLLVRFIILQHL